MDTKKVLWTGVLAGVLMTFVNALLNIVYSRAYPSFNEIYANTAIFRAMDDPLMMMFWVYPLVLGIGLAWAWDYTKNIFKKDSIFMAGLKFGFAYFVVAGLPAFIINVTSFNLPVMMVGSWAKLTLTNGLVAGWVFAKWAR